jgi:hypothetical protein
MTVHTFEKHLLFYRSLFFAVPAKRVARISLPASAPPCIQVQTDENDGNTYRHNNKRAWSFFPLMEPVLPIDFPAWRLIVPFPLFQLKFGAAVVDTAFCGVLVLSRESAAFYNIKTLRLNLL